MTSRTLPSLPTLPHLAATNGLRAGLAFLEDGGRPWTMPDLIDWFAEHLVKPQLMGRPQMVREPGVAPVVLDPRADSSARLDEILARARGRVVAALRGLVAPVTDDRFLNAAIYGGRVRRAAVAGRAVWVPSPREIDFLGDIVLSLFAADILLDRDFFRAHLCFCEICGRVSFKDGAEARAICSDHRSPGSGYTFRPR